MGPSVSAFSIVSRNNYLSWREVFGNLNDFEFKKRFSSLEITTSLGERFSMLIESKEMYLMIRLEITTSLGERFSEIVDTVINGVLVSK